MPLNPEMFNRAIGQFKVFAGNLSFEQKYAVLAVMARMFDEALLNEPVVDKCVIETVSHLRQALNFNMLIFPHKFVPTDGEPGRCLQCEQGLPFQMHEAKR